MSYMIKPTWHHAGSRYMCVTHGVIDDLQTRFFNNLSLEGAIPDIDGERAAVIVAESLEADRIWNLPPDQLLTGFTQGPESDFKSAALSEMFFEAVESSPQDEPDDAKRDIWAMAIAGLEKVARSPTASPLLWYEDIYFNLSQYDTSQKALDWLKRSLAHNLHFHTGNIEKQILRDLADAHLTNGDLERGLQMLIALLHHEPDDIWTYNLMAISFDQFGLTRLGEEAIQRGLQLLDVKGDEEQLRPQLEDCKRRMQTSASPGREAELKPALIEAFQAALTLDFDAGEPKPIAALCHQLVPDLDQIPFKRPLKPDQMPLPDRDRIFHALSQSETSTPKKKTRRGRRRSTRR